MKSTGIVRKVDELGRIVLPIELRRTLDIEEKNGLEIFVEGDRIILKKHQSGCAICGQADNLITLAGTKICPDCIKTAASLIEKDYRDGVGWVVDTQQK